MHQAIRAINIHEGAIKIEQQINEATDGKKVAKIAQDAVYEGFRAATLGIG